MIALPKGRQSSIKGAVVNIPVNEQSVCSVLPRTPDQAGFIPIKLKRLIQFKSYEKFENIRLEKVLEALHWLQANNPLYALLKNVWISNKKVQKKTQRYGINSLLMKTILTIQVKIIPLNIQWLLKNKHRQKITICMKKINIIEIEETEDPVSKLREVSFETCVQIQTQSADLRWHDTIQIIARQQGKSLTPQQIDELYWEEKCKYLRSNPLTAARHFQYILDALLSTLVLAVNCQSKPLFLQNQIPTAWVTTRPWSVDGYFTCALPSEEDDPELFKLVDQLQRHLHSAACRKTSKFCRFNYPKPIAEKTIMVQTVLSLDKSPEQEIAERKAACETLFVVKEYLTQTENVLEMSTNQVLTNCNLTSDLYYDALQKSAKNTSIYLKLNPCEININNYNPVL
ncbi:unnamed protein product [Mytilus coruscus]|uniref:DUF6570 domain-containing protein n=1 Tax=Mytilus coruscus TaxID=42192 RepID=A0A6J8BGE6_MYTCO|nr:unnamed protein product [Mytilus coruscus]